MCKCKQSCLTLAHESAGPANADRFTPAAGVLELRLRLPSGASVQRRFDPSDTIGRLMAFVGSQNVDMAAHQICTAFPKKVGQHLKLVVLSGNGTACIRPSAA